MIVGGREDDAGSRVKWSIIMQFTTRAGDRVLVNASGKGLERKGARNELWELRANAIGARMDSSAATWIVSCQLETYRDKSVKAYN